MPRPGPPRILVATKLTKQGIDWIDQRARDEGLTIRGGDPNRSEMLRLMIAYAATYMPKGWRKPVADPAETP
jgi:hypothetical protein